MAVVVIAVVVVVVLAVGFFVLKGKKIEPVPVGTGTVEDMGQLGVGKGAMKVGPAMEGEKGSGMEGGQEVPVAPGGGR